MQTVPADILHFWFSEKVKPLWFNSTPEFDAELKERYADIFHAVLNGQLSEWQQTADGCVALVVILDQFPLNMYRGLPESFAGEALARDITRGAVNNGFDQQMPGEQKAFLYMPLMHSENIADQDLSVQLFEAAGLKENLRFANHHRDIVRRFGRFPHRNKILGRTSTQAELDYLASKEAFHG
ncbi:MAG: hypothetical protein AMJ55_03555 [Gammaproteobacteria bacterium SG8_15]|nr:MAG: hypothetical protein AMJ55_03555 [Gammaproteobacteria bacterium SG8_15]